MSALCGNGHCLPRLFGAAPNLKISLKCRCYSAMRHFPVGRRVIKFSVRTASPGCETVGDLVFRMNSLAARTVSGFAGLMIVLAILLFASAGTVDFWQAWAWLFIFATSSGLITMYLWKTDPQLLERRVRGGPTAEQEQAQRLIQLGASIAFIGLIVAPSLDRRFGWSHVPLQIVLVGDVLEVLGFFVVLFVFRENTFTSATIEVAAAQTVVSSGPYAIIRHPMYSGALLMLLGTPLALGSWWGLAMFVPLGVVIVLRLLDEEAFLSKSLPGYIEYRRRKRFRLIPHIW